MSNQPNIDLMGHQRHRELSEEAMRQFIESASKIGEIADEQRHHTELLEEHNTQFERLNDKYHEESLKRSKGDVSNRWFSLFVAVLSCIVTYAIDHQSEIAEYIRRFL